MAVVAMGPPMPSREIGRALGGDATAPVTLACWLDYACPFSAKFFRTMTTEVVPHYGARLRFVFYHQVQPWHPQSTMLHEAAIATRALGGVDAFWKFSAALFAAQTEYFDANVYDTSRSAMYAKLAALAAASAGVDEEEVMKKLARTEARSS